MSSDARACTTKRSRRQVEAEEAQHQKGGGPPPPCHARPLQRQRGASHTAPAKVEKEGEDTKDQDLSQYLHQAVFAANNDLHAERNPQACADALDTAKRTLEGTMAELFRAHSADLMDVAKTRLWRGDKNAHLHGNRGGLSLRIPFQDVAAAVAAAVGVRDSSPRPCTLTGILVDYEGALSRHDFVWHLTPMQWTALEARVALWQYDRKDSPEVLEGYYVNIPLCAHFTDGLIAAGVLWSQER